MAKIAQQLVYIDGMEIPIDLYREYRSSIRVSIATKSVILRVPWFFSTKQREEQLLWCKDWILKQFRRNPAMKQRFVNKVYRSGDILSINGKAFEILVEYADRKSHVAKITAEKIHLTLSNLEAVKPTTIKVKRLISKVVAQYFLAEIKERVLALNALHFQKEIKSVRLKYNKSNWGSCSAAGNVNLSTRLLFAPQEVQDYVIIHELAHLVELNHSPAFWAEVKRAMPDYLQHERWLKLEGPACDF